SGALSAEGLDHYAVGMKDPEGKARAAALPTSADAFCLVELARLELATPRLQNTPGLSRTVAQLGLGPRMYLLGPRSLRVSSRAGRHCLSTPVATHARSRFQTHLDDLRPSNRPSWPRPSRAFVPPGSATGVTTPDRDPALDLRLVGNGQDAQLSHAPGTSRATNYELACLLERSPVSGRSLLWGGVDSIRF